MELEHFLTLIGDSVSMSELLLLYGGWFVFLAVFFTGETAVLASFVLVEQGKLSFGLVWVVALLATLCADMFWFMMGRFFPTPRITNRVSSKMFTAVQKFLDKVIQKRFFIMILCMKFFIGTRLLAILYCARSSISTTRFVVYNSISTGIYIAVLSGLGLLLSEILSKLFHSNHSELFMVVAIVIVVCLVVVTNFFGKKYFLSRVTASSDQ